MKMRKTTLCTAITLCMSGGIAMDVQAADDDDVMTVWSSPVANTSEILTQDTITKLDKRNVADALSVVPGVSLQKSGGRNELQVRVRGFDNRQVPVFMMASQSTFPMTAIWI